jgi:hypothetical protein
MTRLIKHSCMASTRTFLSLFVYFFCNFGFCFYRLHFNRLWCHKFGGRLNLSIKFHCQRWLLSILTNDALTLLLIFIVTQSRWYCCFRSYLYRAYSVRLNFCNNLLNWLSWLNLFTEDAFAIGFVFLPFFWGHFDGFLELKFEVFCIQLLFFCFFFCENSRIE